MTDIIIIIPSQFNSVKDTINACENITKKYNDLYEKYECFSATSQQMLPVFQPNKNTRITSSTTSRSTITRSIKTTLIKAPLIKRQMIGYLNIINEENYNKIFNKIRLLINSNNIQYITSELLIKSTLQIYYIHIFIKLLNNILDVCDTIERGIVFDTLNQYVTKFIVEKEYKELPQKLENAYDYYCSLQKHKSKINAKNIIILESIKMNLIEIKIDNYISYILEELNESDNYDVIEILLQLIIEIKKYYNEYPIIINKERLLSLSDSQRIKFILEKL